MKRSSSDFNNQQREREGGREGLDESEGDMRKADQVFISVQSGAQNVQVIHNNTRREISSADAVGYPEVP